MKPALEVVDGGIDLPLLDAPERLVDEPDEPGEVAVSAHPTPVETVRDVLRASTSIGVARCTNAHSYVTADDVIETEYELEYRHRFLGVPPATVVMEGGAVGTRSETPYETPRIKVGATYLLLFRQARIRPHLLGSFLHEGGSSDVYGYLLRDHELEGLLTSDGRTP